MNNTNDFQIGVFEIEQHQTNQPPVLCTSQRFSDCFNLKKIWIFCLICCAIFVLFLLCNSGNNDVLPNSNANTIVNVSPTANPNSVETTTIEIWNPEDLKKN